MVSWATRKQLMVSAAVFVTGASLSVYGAHLSFVNIAPQQARLQARDKYVKERLRKWLDD